MGSPLPQMTLTAFLEWENAQVEKHEFFGGGVHAISDSRRVHGVVSLDLFALLRQQLRGTACRALASSMKLQVGQDIFYPDVFVTCDAADLRTEQIFRARRACFAAAPMVCSRCTTSATRRRSSCLRSAACSPGTICSKASRRSRKPEGEAQPLLRRRQHNSVSNKYFASACSSAATSPLAMFGTMTLTRSPLLPPALACTGASATPHCSRTTRATSRAAASQRNCGV
jgi:Putative restriction endonuclease